MSLRVHVITLFPDLVNGFLDYSILGRARERGALEVVAHDLRRWAEDSYRTVDDEPYGGGAGMVLKVEPIDRALRHLGADPGCRKPGRRAVLLSPQGTPFRQEKAREYAELEELVLVCGRYEGVDERVGRYLVDEELSIGDYVLSGGELPALVVVEAVSRLLPGVLGDPDSSRQDTHSRPGVLDHPHFTRPREYHGMMVPETLLSGDHERIRRWRRREALRATLVKRPDLLERARLGEEDRELLEELLPELEPDDQGSLERILKRTRPDGEHDRRQAP